MYYMQGKTESPLKLSQRREQAFRYLSRGYTNADIAKELKVTPETVYSYRKQWKAKIQEEKEQNPTLLQDILQNTFQMLEEYEQIRTELWKQYEQTNSAQLKNQIVGQLTKVQEARAKLMGLFGVKHEYFIEVNNIKIIQEKILEFMRNELCLEDRMKLEQYIVNDLSQYMSPQAQLPKTIEVKSD